MIEMTRAVMTDLQSGNRSFRETFYFPIIFIRPDFTVIVWDAMEERLKRTTVIIGWDSRHQYERFHKTNFLSIRFQKFW